MVENLTDKLRIVLIKDSNVFNDIVQNVYQDLLNFYNNYKDELDDDVAAELKNIISLIEVSNDYNQAFKKIDNLEMFLNPNMCKSSYPINDD